MLNYEQIANGGFDLPTDAIHFDVGADGRLYAVAMDALWQESATGSRRFVSVRSPAFGFPEFLRISPSGRKAAVGNYSANKVYVFELGATTSMQIPATSYDAEWFNERFLAVSNQGSDGPSPPSDVILIDTTTGAVRTLIERIPGYSGGITFDLDGSLYTGIGVAQPPGPDTGLIKAFKYTAWKHLLDGPGAALTFSTAGRPAANVLSAAFLTFDADWNLCIGGGGGTDAAGDAEMGFAGVVSHSGLCASLYNQPPVETNAASHVFQRLDPTAAEANEYWLLNANPIRREIYLKKYDSPTVTVFRPRLTRMQTSTAFQLGDNPGYYPGKRFVGMRLAMPLELPEPAASITSLCVRLVTSFIQSLGVSSHRVRLNGAEIGRLEGGEYNELRETRDLLVSHTDFPDLFPLTSPVQLEIEVDPAPGPGLADDFVLESAEVIVIPI